MDNCESGPFHHADPNIWWNEASAIMNPTLIPIMINHIAKIGSDHEKRFFGVALVKTVSKEAFLITAKCKQVKDVSRCWNLALFDYLHEYTENLGRTMDMVKSWYGVDRGNYYICLDEPNELHLDLLRHEVEKVDLLRNMLSKYNGL